MFDVRNYFDIKLLCSREAGLLLVILRTLKFSGLNLKGVFLLYRGVKLIMKFEKVDNIKKYILD